MSDPRRRIPRTDDCLADPRLAGFVAAVGRAEVKRAVVAAADRARRGEIEPERVIDCAAGLLDPDAVGLRPVVNATGVVVHTNLGRAPLSARAVAAVTRAAGATDVEFDLASGVRAKRGRGALAALAAAVPAAGGVHVVNNAAAALLLCAIAFAPGREILVSRGEMIEIGDGFRLPDLLASTGSRIREVGMTNRTHLRDYTDALGPDTGFVLKVHPSNYRLDGFTTEVGPAELSGLRRPDGTPVPLVVDIGSGLLAPHPVLPDEPDADTMLRAGADVVVCSGDKLLGGPQAGLVLGRTDLVHALSRHPAARALRVDKLTLAGLEATLRGPLPPVRAALAYPAERLHERARDLAARLGAAGVDVDVVPSESTVGGGGAPGVTLPSWALALPESWAPALRTGRPAVVGRLERGRCLLDLRAVGEDEDDAIVAAVRAVAID